MKQRTLVLIIVASLLLRSLLPFLDLFVLTLAVLSLLNQDKLLSIGTTSTLVVLIYSIVFESPAGLLPLINALLFFAFITISQRVTAKGVTPLIFWSLFTIIYIVGESVARYYLTLPHSLLFGALPITLLGTCIALVGIVFILSFKRKI